MYPGSFAKDAQPLQGTLKKPKRQRNKQLKLRLLPLLLLNKKRLKCSWLNRRLNMKLIKKLKKLLRKR